MTFAKISALIPCLRTACTPTTVILIPTLALNFLQNVSHVGLPRLRRGVPRGLLGCLLWLGLSLAFADGPPEGEDPAAWCDANEDACAEWCASHPEEEFCEEPDCE